MLKLIDWLSGFERDSAFFLRAASARFTEDKEVHLFLRRLSRDKRALSRSLKSSASRIKASRRRHPSTPGLHGLKEFVSDSYAYLRASIDYHTTEGALVEGLVDCEYLKWNNLLVSVSAILKSEFPEGMLPLLAQAQRQRRTIERFLASRGHSTQHFRLRASEPVWTEKVLFIGELPELKAEIERDGIVHVASNGDEAVERMRESYYAAILADEETPRLDPTAVLRKAAREYPGIEERFLFLYDGAAPSRKKALRGKARRIPRAHGDCIRGELERLLG